MKFQNNIKLYLLKSKTQWIKAEDELIKLDISRFLFLEKQPK